MLSIFIGTGKRQIITADGGGMTVRPLLVRIGGKVSCLEDAELDEIDEVEFIYRSRLLGLGRVLALPKPVLVGVSEFLRRYHTQPDLFFDCYAFVCMVYGIQPHAKYDLAHYWTAKKFRRKRRGDVVLLDTKQMDDTARLHHVAVYIGRGLYLSVYGAGGYIEVTSLEEMAADYGAESVICLTPRKR